MSVVYSSSINNAFISTVDHLPTDVVRSLWLLQSININIDKLKDKLNELLLRYQKQEVSKDDMIHTYRLLNGKIDHLRQESIQESQALHNQLIAHKLSLSEEVDQLFSIQNKLRNADADLLANKELRERLKTHYKENPLVSQREALKEQEMINNGTLKQSASEKLGLKLLLKLPKKANPLLSVNKKRPKAIARPSALKNSKTNTSRSRTSPKQKVVNKNIKKTTQARPTPTVPEEPIDLPVPIEVDDQKYCFCKQGSFGPMIGCDNEDSCPNGDWFHYKCVGLLNRVDALQYTTGKNKWFCSEHCRDVVLNKIKKKKKKKRSRW